jgi:hypothetical protein
MKPIDSTTRTVSMCCNAKVGRVSLEFLSCKRLLNRRLCHCVHSFHPYCTELTPNHQANLDKIKSPSNKKITGRQTNHYQPLLSFVPRFSSAEPASISPAQVGFESFAQWSISTFRQDEQCGLSFIKELRVGLPSSTRGVWASPASLRSGE